MLLISHLLHPTLLIYEGLFVSIPQQKGQDLILGVIYRPPGQPLELFNHELSILLPALIKSKRKVLLAGDFNVNLLKLDVHEPSQDFFLTL